MVLFAHVTSPRGQRMLEEVLEVQRCAEEELAALAATRRTTEQLGRLMELVTQMGSVLDQHGAYTELDVEFHDVIGEEANNRLLRTMLDPVREVIRDGYVLTEELPKDSAGNRETGCESGARRFRWMPGIRRNFLYKRKSVSTWPYFRDAIAMSYTPRRMHSAHQHRVATSACASQLCPNEHSHRKGVVAST
jgi:hypothetical protein